MPNEPKLARPMVGGIVAALIVISGLVFFLAQPRTPASSREKKPTTPLDRAPEQPAAAARARGGAAHAVDPPRSVTEKIASFFARLEQGEIDGKAMAEFRRELLASDPRTTVLAIGEFLKSGKDHATGESFSIAEGGGELESAPTFRVWLLDVLGVLDRTASTGEGAALSRLVLAVKSSADEWALALRNVAWAEPSGGGFLAAKFREMITHELWLAKPSAGFLEAFDTAVFLRDPSVMQPLEQLGERPEVDRAAAVALDRLAEANPLGVMNYLNQNPGAFSRRPMVRADFFAKADLSQPAQRAVLEAYLARADVLLPEKTKLVEALAAPGSFVAETLFSSAAPPVDDDARVAAVERVTAEWIAARRFPELTSALADLQRQLRTP